MSMLETLESLQQQAVTQEQARLRRVREDIDQNPYALVASVDPGVEWLNSLTITVGQYGDVAEVAQFLIEGSYVYEVSIRPTNESDIAWVRSGAGKTLERTYLNLVK